LFGAVVSHEKQRVELCCLFASQTERIFAKGMRSDEHVRTDVFGRDAVARVLSHVTFSIKSLRCGPPGSVVRRFVYRNISLMLRRVRINQSNDVIR
jgi:hypothetical protein